MTKRVPKVIAYGELKEYVQNGKVEMARAYYQKDMVQLKRTKGNNAWFITAFELWE